MFLSFKHTGNFDVFEIKHWNHILPHSLWTISTLGSTEKYEVRYNGKIIPEIFVN